MRKVRIPGSFYECPAGFPLGVFFAEVCEQAPFAIFCHARNTFESYAGSHETSQLRRQNHIHC